MIPELRREYNERFDQRRYELFLERLDRRFVQPISFRLCETPFFVPTWMQKMCESSAIELAQLVHSPDYLRRSDESLTPEVTVPGQTGHANFIVVDYAMALDEEGAVVPRLIELQGFPSLMGYQLLLAEIIHEHFALPTDLSYINGGLSRTELLDLMRRTIVADHAPDQTILMELDPWNQKTSPDFRATTELLGIPVVDARDVIVRGDKVSYRDDRGREIPVTRIFNRTIVDELQKKNVTLPFNWSDELDVTWAGHPNWFFRISKFSLPFLDHPVVPPASFLSDVDRIPDDLENHVLKPLYSFAGSGVIVGPTRDDIAAVPEEERHLYLLQKKITFADVIDTPVGGLKAEMRVMLLWPDDALAPIPAMGLVRMGRGEKMGVDANSAGGWIGASCNFFEGREG